MPELHTIQTLYRLDRNNFNQIRYRICEILKFLNLFDDEMEKWLSEFSWNPSDNGFVYSKNPSPIRTVKFESSVFELFFVLMGWTNDIGEWKHGDFLEFQFDFISEQIEDHSDLEKIKYRSQAIPYLCQALKSFSLQAPEFGVFLCDEIQDFRPFEGILENDPEKKYCFDLGFIPKEIKTFEHLPSNEFCLKSEERGIWLARKDVFPEDVLRFF